MTLEQEKLSQVVIRPALQTDLPAIERILRATIQTPYGGGNVGKDELAEVQMELARLNKVFSTEKDGQILLAEDPQGVSLGFAFFGDVDPKVLSFTGSESSSTLELRLLYLNPAKRMQGIGSKLLSAVEERARSLGKATVELTSGPRFISIGTGSFYKKSGYSNVGVMQNYFEGQYPAWVFQKKI